MRISLGKYHQMCKDHLSNYQRACKYLLCNFWKMCKDLWVDISGNAKIVNICWQILEKHISQKERQEHAGSVMHASYVTNARWVAHAQSGSCGVLWANICVNICGLISADVPRSFCKYQQTCEDMWANISRRANICGPISVHVQRSFSKYQQKCEDRLANINRRAKIYCGKISADVQRSFGKYHLTCKDLWENIRRRAKFCGQISADGQRSVGKDLWANIRICSKIWCG